MFLTENRVLVD